MLHLSDTERETLAEAAYLHRTTGAPLRPAVEAILTARLARVEALAERIDAGEHLPLGLRTSMLIRAALAAPTPDEVQP